MRFVLGRQARSGGWAWYGGGAPDSNDTAAAIQALRAAGVRGKPIRRGLAYLRRLQNRDGGFELSPGRGSDSQSTAWAIQAFVSRAQAGPARVDRLPAPHAPGGRQLPLLGEVRDDARLGHLAGATRARPAGLPTH